MNTPSADVANRDAAISNEAAVVSPSTPNSDGGGNE